MASYFLTFYRKTLDKNSFVHLNEIINDILIKINGHLLRLRKTPAELLCPENADRKVDGYIKFFGKKRQFQPFKNSLLAG